MVSAPETLTSDGDSSTLRAFTFPSTTYADHLHLNNTYSYENWNLNYLYWKTKHTLYSNHSLFGDSFTTNLVFDLVLETLEQSKFIQTSKQMFVSMNSILVQWGYITYLSDRIPSKPADRSVVNSKLLWKLPSKSP